MKYLYTSRLGRSDRWSRALAETMTEPEFKNRPAVGTEPEEVDPPPKITPCASAFADEYESTEAAALIVPELTKSPDRPT